LSYFTDYLSQVNAYLLASLKSEKTELIIIDLAIFRQINQIPFKTATEYVKLLDSFIKYLANLCLSHEIIFHLTSPFSFAENYFEKTVELSTSPQIIPTQNAVPHLHIDSKFVGKVSKGGSILEKLIESKETLSKIHQELLQNK
jgi:hypothetical protein